MSARSFLVHLLFPPVCRGCGARFDIFQNDEPLPLCSDCLERWQQAKLTPCDQCGDAVSICQCMPPILQEAGCAALVKAVSYHADQKDLPERLILRCKRVRDRELFAFFAADVQLPLWQATASADEPGDVLITYVPRRAAAASAEGVDQGYELARAIGRALEMPLVRTLINQGKVAQKTLDHEHRQQAAALAIRLRKKASDAVRGKTVVLVDDITTVGATLAAATEQLYAAGAAKVICCVIGVTRAGN